MPLNQPLVPEYNQHVLDRIYKALLSAEPCIVLPIDGEEITGWIWEIYRSIQTESVRFRMSDESGYVYHFNTLDVKEVI